jgi:pyruvate-ferredoxin/flavodoxin oxidoreductase
MGRPRPKNLWGETPRVVEMQSEGGAAGAVHGGLLGGALTTTFTASQGLLLMIPNLYKIAGELLPFTMHVSARALAAQGLSIFGDHQDVMACRATGAALLCSTNGQEAHDFALIGHAASHRSRIPFIHFFDGFRTSHEVSKIDQLSDDDLRAVIDEQDIAAFKARAMSPDRPTLRGTAQNPDVYFQGREAVNRFYEALPGAVQATMDKLAAVTGRNYHLSDYHGHPEAERVVVAMGSGIETHRRDRRLACCPRGKSRRRLRPPLPAVRYRLVPRGAAANREGDCRPRPHQGTRLAGRTASSQRARRLAESRSALAGSPRVIGGRYGLGSKEFTPAMVRAVFRASGASRSRSNHFTVGINDDVTGTSLAFRGGFRP